MSLHLMLKFWTPGGLSGTWKLQAQKTAQDDVIDLYSLIEANFIQR